jgi:HlyD family secretion protein
MQIISLDELWISAWVDETAMPALAEKQQAQIIFRSEPARSYSGIVSRLGRETDRETREFLVDVHITEMPKNWTIGQRAEVFIETSHQDNALLLPSDFLMQKGGKSGVFVDADGKAQWREVTPGLRGKNQVSITLGLSAGDEIVRPPLAASPALTEGQRITHQP